MHPNLDSHISVWDIYRGISNSWNEQNINFWVMFEEI